MRFRNGKLDTVQSNCTPRSKPSWSWQRSTKVWPCLRGPETRESQRMDHLDSGRASLIDFIWDDFNEKQKPEMAKHGKRMAVEKSGPKIHKQDSVEDGPKCLYVDGNGPDD